MRVLKWKLAGAAGVAVGLLASWAAGLDSTPVDLGSISVPGLRGLFCQFEPGPKEIDGISFMTSDARVSIRAGETKRVEFAPVVCAGVHFLHFTENAGDQIGSYTLIYTDGEQAAIPIRGGLTISDWWKPGPLAFAAQAHADTLMHGDRKQPIAFWRFSARNPRPDVPVSAIEIGNADTSVTINLVAVTLTSRCEEKIGSVPVWVNGMDEESFFLAVLAQPGAIAGKEKACEQLKRVGSTKSVPALAACLTDEKLSHPARLALAAMPYPEAHDALRKALGASPGAVKAGIIESLGMLRNAADVPELARLLKDDDPVIAMSAALALGRIGGHRAVTALKKAARGGEGRFKMAALDALMNCAERLCGKHPRSARALYKEVFKQCGHGYAGTAAYLGLIRTSPREAEKLIEKALLSKDPVLWDAALPAVRESGTVKNTQAITALLDQAPGTVLPGLIEALAQRGDKSATPALAPLASHADPAIAMPAIQALAIIGNGMAVPALAKAAAHADEPIRSTAQQALAQLDAPDVPGALLAAIEGAGPAETGVLAKAMGQRREESVAPALRKLVQSPNAAVRTAAVRALAETGAAQDAEIICQAMDCTENDKERTAMKRALTALGIRLGVPAEYAQALLAGLKKDNPMLRGALLDVCGKVSHESLLPALESAAADNDAVVKDAAIRALSETENPGALPVLLGLLDKTSDLTQRVLIFRGIARLASNGKDIELSIREDALTHALAVAERPEEKRLFLGALGGCPSLTALKTVERYLPQDDVVAEAVSAWGQIAKPLLASHAGEVRESAPGVLVRAQKAGVAQSALTPLLDVMRTLTAVAVPGDKVHFKHIVVDPRFRSEGVAVADVDRDGFNDILAGDLWYKAPDWTPHEIRPPQTYDPNTGYSRCFANFAMDVDEDGWTDSIVIGMPGGPAHWYRNPGENAGHWTEYLLATSACGETPIFGDLLGDGKPVPVFAMNNRVTWFRTGQDKRAPWLAFPMSHQMGSFAQFGHGLGMGDINGDGRMDIVSTEGWWDGPMDRTRPDWGFHPARLGPACANMVVYDVDGDGDNDVITSSAHEYGIWWFEQRNDNGAPTFEQHEIHKGISQTHALILADINNDGLQDLVTGKRYYAHCGHDPGCHEPAVLCWLELQRSEPGKFDYRMHEIDHDSGVGTQFEVCDFDGDGLLDVVTSNKKGVHVFLQRRSK